jgi:hypothetical protein
VWLDRAVAVPTGTLPFADAEGLVAYAAKQAQLYSDLAEMAETTRTEVKLARGKKRTVWEPVWDPVVGREGVVGTGGTDADDADADNDNDSADNDDDERGDIESDEELGGEVDEI